MDIKKFEKQLVKINGVFSAIAEEGEANSIERDLLRSYLLKLYEALYDNDIANVGEVAKPKKTAKKASATKTAPVRKQRAKPVVEEIVEPEEIEELAVVEPVKAEEPVEKPVLVEPTAEKADESEFGALFEDFSSGEIGDKLSQRPIKDLTKAWSINDKVFTIKELFAGDSDSFRQTARELNELSNFDEAKTYLMKGVAKKYNWSSEKNFKKARHFIKLIKRRYN